MQSHARTFRYLSSLKEIVRLLCDLMIIVYEQIKLSYTAVMCCALYMQTGCIPMLPFLLRLLSYMQHISRNPLREKME